MSEKATALTAEELQQVQELRKQFNNIALSLGELELRKRSLLNSYDELYNNEKELYKNLGEKYGNGTINLADGSITYLEETPNE